MTTRALPRGWAVALVAILVVGLCETAVRLGESRLEPPQEWYAIGAQARIADADQIAAAGIESDILFVGTSMVRRGIDVEVIEDRMPTVDQAHNAALPAAQVQVIERWLLEEMIPRVRPTRVVWGISSLDFNGNRADPVIDAYNSARATRTGWVGSVDRLLGKVSALSRNRLTLRDPASIGALAGWGDGPGNRGVTRVGRDRLLAPVNTWEGERATLDEELGRIRTEVLVDWAIGPADAEAFHSTLTALGALGIEVVVVLMPVPDRYVESHPGGEADFAEFVRFVETELHPLDVPYLDYSRSLPDSAFHDVTHLTGEAARRFSARLADDLTRMGW